MRDLLQKVKIAIISMAVVLSGGAALVPATVHAAIDEKVCQGLKQTGDDVNCNNVKEDTDNNFGALAKRVINIFSIVVGAVSVVMIIIGGFRYIISGGDSNGVSGAKNTILYAIVGLVIVLFAQIIVRFVLSNVGN